MLEIAIIINLILTAVLIITVVIFGIHMKGLFKVQDISRDMENILRKLWIDTGIEKRVGELELHVREIKSLHKSLEQLLRVPTGRGSIGEITLSEILKDQLPPDMFAIRGKLPNGKIPDAYIKTSSGIVCIDSKFPLDNYRRMMESEYRREKERFKKAFLNDVRNHLEKVAHDYIRPQDGTADFAFVYIPSEAVYWFLVNEGYGLLRDFARKGVQVVSPLTLSHKIELIKAGVHSKKLSEEAEKIKNAILELEDVIKQLDRIWKTAYSTHFRNLNSKMEEMNQALSRLKNDFERISRRLR